MHSEPGIVDEDLDRSAPLLRLRDDAGGGIGEGQVRAEDFGGHAVTLRQLVRERFQLVAPPRHQHHVPAIFRGEPGEFPADAARGTGDEGRSGHRFQRDVLTLLANGKSNRDIGSEIHIEESTVKSHLKNIFMKLGVNSRRAAVRRAEELELFQKNAKP